MKQYRIRSILSVFRILAAILIPLCVILIADSLFAAQTDVTGLLSVTRSGLVLNRSTNTYDSRVSIKNISSSTIGAPVLLAIVGMPGTASLENAEGFTADNKPYVTVQIPSRRLLPGEQITNLVLKFNNPTRAPFTADFQILGEIVDSLPPDPGNAGKQTLAGIDINHNGIRDDLEILIAVNYGSSERTKQGLNQFAVAAQQAVTSQTRQQSLDGATAESRALECLAYMNTPDLAWQRVKVLSINTPERYRAWAAHEARLSGGIFPGRDISDWKGSCQFDPDGLPN